jgi:nitrilase
MRVAMWQTVGHLADPPANLQALETTAEAAARAGAQLLVCPELWLTGYNAPKEMPRLAEAADGSSAIAIAKIARQHELAIVYGYAERDADGRIFNSAQAIGPDGVVLANYRKTHLFGPMEKETFREGDAFAPVFTLHGWNLGLLICYDVEFPEPVRALRLSGAEAVIVPTALDESYGATPAYLIPARAIESQVFIAYCNHAGMEGTLRYLGGSCLVGPDGRAVVSAGGGDALLIGDLDRQTQVLAAPVYPYMLDRRPELYASLAQSPAR